MAEHDAATVTAYPEYQSVIITPVGKVGLIAQAEVLVKVDFLPETEPLRPLSTAILRETARQIAAFFAEPGFCFDLPTHLEGSVHQLAVWQQISEIGCGDVTTYSEIARRIGSVPRAVGGACGQNPLPILIPCHRVVATTGIGGFNAHRNGRDWVPIKRWLLAHESQDLFSNLSRL